jgi:tetratricopeptide (TPR) repeat protein
MKIIDNFKQVILLILVFILISTKIIAQVNQDLTSANLKSKTTEEELINTKKHLSEILRQNIGSIKLIVGNNNYNIVSNLGYPKEIADFDERIEFTFTDNKNVKIQIIKLYYSYILEDKIKATTISSNTDDGRTVSENHLKLGNISLVTSMNNSVVMKLLINDLTVIQNKLNEDRFKMEEFVKIVSDYRSLKVKPLVSEEQRKYIIQANSFAQIMQYDYAIDQYIKVLALDQISYPEAYLNLALLLGQTNRYYAAINFMKKYLLLVPNSADVQNAKDKIKDWEIILQN